MGAPLTAAEASRTLFIPANRIRKWAFRGQVHRYPDGKIDAGCIWYRSWLDEIPCDERSKYHEAVCDAGKMK